MREIAVKRAVVADVVPPEVARHDLDVPRALHDRTVEADALKLAVEPPKALRPPGGEGGGRAPMRRERRPEHRGAGDEHPRVPEVAVPDIAPRGRLVGLLDEAARLRRDVAVARRRAVGADVNVRL